MTMKYLRNESLSSLLALMDDQHANCDTVKLFDQHFIGTDTSSHNIGKDKTALQMPLQDAYVITQVIPGQVWKTEVVLSLLQRIVAAPSIKVPANQRK